MVSQDRTLAILKPDAVGHPWLFSSIKTVEDDEGNATQQQVVERIADDKSAKMRERIIREGFEIEQERRICLSLERAKEFYKEHEGKPFYNELVSYMCSGPIEALVLKREDAIQSWRQLMGPTDPEAAREMEEEALEQRKKSGLNSPNADDESDEQGEQEGNRDGSNTDDGWEVMENWCLRAAFGANVTRNSCHGSDSEFAAMREINFFFPPPQKLERSLIVVKPHVVEAGRVDEAVAALEGYNLMVIAQAERTITQEEAELLVEEMKGGLLYHEVVESLSSGPLVALIVEGDNAHINSQLALGPSSCNMGLRAKFGTDEIQNGFHIPNSATQLRKNLDFFFPTPLEIERTLCIVKPKYASKSKTSSDIVNFLHRSGFEIAAKRTVQLSPQKVESLLDCFADAEGARDELVTGKSLVMILAKPSAVKALKVLVGPSHPNVARRKAPMSLNALFGTGDTSVLLVSNTSANAKRAMTSMFSQVSNDKVVDVDNVFDCSVGEDTTFQEVLVAGLTHVCRKKPTELDAIRMLGRYLLEHNPKKTTTNDDPVAVPQPAPVSPPRTEVEIAETKETVEHSEPMSESELSSLPNLGIRIPIPSALDNRRVLFVFGPPGCGKRTQCKLVTDAYGFAHISPAELIKIEVESGSSTGAEIQQVLDSGEILPAQTVVSLIRKAMRRSGSSKFLIDNFPRDLNQAFAFEQQVCPCESVLKFQCPTDIIVKRTTETTDCTEDEVRAQIASFEERSNPVIEFYDKIGKVKTVDASDQSVKRVFHSIRQHIEPRVIFVFGGPGSGKTSLCKRVAKEFGYVHLCASALLRELASKGTEEGQRLKRFIARGQLVPTEEMMRVLRDAMDEHPGDKFILDGFPRSLKQYHAFESQVTKASFSIFLRVPVEHLRSRAVQNKMGGFKKRLQVFVNEEMEVVNAMKVLGQVREIDASGTQDQVWNVARLNFTADVVIALGPPGSKVDSYCSQLGKQFGYTVLTQKSILEAETLRGGEYGHIVDDYQTRGEQVPTDIKLRIFKNVITNSGSHKFIIQGFPQYAEVLDKWEEEFGPTKKVLYFDCAESACLEATSSEELHEFNTKTLPLINKYARNGVLVTIDASKPEDEVFVDAAQVFHLEYVVVVGNGKLSEKEMTTECEKLAKSQNYQVVDVPRMIQEAEFRSGSLEGDLARAKRSEVVVALLRSALEGSGKRGLLLRHFPQTTDRVAELVRSLGVPKRLFHISCPVSAIRDNIIASGATEEEADVTANTYSSRVELVERPVVELFKSLGTPTTVVQSTTLSTSEFSIELLKPFQPELVLLVGRSGTGRGELATQLARHHGFVHLHATTLLREEVERGTASGRVIARALELERSVPLDHCIPVLKRAIVKHNATRFLLDGFPRMVGDGYPMVHDQYFALEEEIGPIKAVINLQVAQEVCDERTQGMTSEERAQSNEIYRLQKVPVLDFCRSLSSRLVLNIDASPTPEVVAGSVMEALEQQAAEEAAELRQLTLTAQDIMNEKIAAVVAKYEADESHVEAVEKYFSQFDLNGDGQLTFGEMMAKMQAWGLEQDPKDYMGVKTFEDESVITKDEWYKFILTAVFLLGKKETNEEENGEDDAAEE